MGTSTHEIHISDGDFQTVRDVVYKHCGISLGDEKVALVRARVTRQMREGGYRTVREYLDHVLAERSGDAFTGFIDAISTNLTNFFREKEHFDYLAGTVLPALLARKREAGDARILVWSAACSSGEEPYTLAMTLLETINRVARGWMQWDVRILATDISTRMLAKAREGVYESARLAAVPPALRSAYFTDAGEDETGAKYAIRAELRNIVRFRHLNLIDAWPFKGPFDFIFCRNVMIYFEKSTQQDLVDRFWNCLRPGGLLFTGHSESLMGISHRFANRKPAVYQRPAEDTARESI